MQLARRCSARAGSDGARRLSSKAACSTARADAGGNARRAPIGAYTLERPLGAGGMGSVWLARRSDGRYEASVAVKLLNLALLGRGGG